LHRQVSKPADTEHGHALMQLRIRPAQPAIDRVTRAEDGGCLLEGNLVGNEIGCVGIHQHVLGMSALRLNSRALHVGAEHFTSTLAPFAAPTGGLNPRGAHAITHLSHGHIGSDGNHLADGLVT
jgi:hypothetical protein